MYKGTILNPITPWLVLNLLYCDRSEIHYQAMVVVTCELIWIRALKFEETDIPLVRKELVDFMTDCCTK